MDTNMRHKITRNKPSLEARISMYRKKGKSQTTLNKYRSLESRLSNRTPSLLSQMSPHRSSSDTPPDGSDSNLWSATIATEESQRMKLLPLSTSSLTEDHSCQKKRKRQLSDSAPKRSTQQKRELSVDLQQQNLQLLAQPSMEQCSLSSIVSKDQPTLLSRIGTTVNCSDNPTMGPNQTLTLANQRKGPESRSLTCPGTSETSPTNRVSTQVVLKPSSLSDSSTETLRPVSSTSALQQELRTISHLPNGSESSRGNPLTSTKSCLLSTGLQLLRSRRQALETQISCLDQLKQQGRLPRHRTGQQHGDGLQGQSPLFFPIEPTNSKTMRSTSRVSLQQKSQQGITESSSTTSRSGISFVEDNRTCLPIHPNLCSSIQPSLCWMGCNTLVGDVSHNPHHVKPQHAIDSTIKGAVVPIANSVMPAEHVEVPTTERQPVGHP